ncbi:MAG TPA: aldo/keto reductase [Thermoanaerobaculaceae bacterium]|nr:aldo/keto reductase [Thermoanaerobaculaceae bacterium]
MTRALGTTGLEVGPLGLGAGPLGDPAMDEREVERLLVGALDLGVTLVDTARSYGLAEERIGRHLARRRSEVVLSTKVGYGIDGHADWTGPCVAAGIDEAMRRLRTDHLDIVHLHSCPLETLRRGDVLVALLDAVVAGKVRVAAYSGEGEALAWAAASGAFGAVQTSVNLCDRASLATVVPGTRAHGLGVLAKRTLCNGVWRDETLPPQPDKAEYWRRWHALDLPLTGWDPLELAVRFAAHAPGVDAALVGTTRVENLRRTVELAARGRLPADVLAALDDRYRETGNAWPGVV